MADIREQPLRFVPRSVSDTVEGDNSPEGACMSLQNLLFAPDTPNAFVCRPANLKLSSFSGFTTPGVVSVAFRLGNIIYGMIQSAHFAGHDEPFAYDVVGTTFQTVTGASSANTPVTQATSGAWTPPTMDMVGQRIIVTHPGFNFSAGYAFGYFDISGFTLSTLGDTTSGSPTITGNPTLTGLSPGYTITGTGIPANTTIKNFLPFNLSTTGDTHTNTTIDNVANVTGLAVGQTIAGLGIPAGATITAISGTTLTISAATTATATGVALSISGGTITLSANASASNSGTTLSIAGGTVASPLWAAGNTTGETQLAAVPQAIRQFSNRAYFAQANNLVFTDTLSLNISNTSGVQVLVVGDSTAIIGLCGLPEFTSTGGVLQALIAFKANFISQVTGDAALGTLALNTLSGTVGSSAGRSIVQTPEGIAFMANDGIRKISLVGEVSEVEENLAVPFIYAVQPSRVCAAYNSGIYRICVQNGNALGSPYQGYYYYLRKKSWTGPHTFEDDCLVPYDNDFITFSNAIPATLWQSFSVQGHSNIGNTFIENGVQMLWNYITAPMTNLKNMYANNLIRSTFEMSPPSDGATYIFQASDESEGVLATATVTVPSAAALWDAFDWGDGTLWGAKAFGLHPYIVPWTAPPIFSRLVAQVSGNSSLGLKLGSWFFGYKRLNYLLQ